MVCCCLVARATTDKLSVVASARAQPNNNKPLNSNKRDQSTAIISQVLDWITENNFILYIGECVWFVGMIYNKKNKET